MSIFNAVKICLSTGFILLALSATCLANDVVVLYDTSGSLKRHAELRSIIEETNRAVSELIWNGSIRNESDWNIATFPDKEEVLPNSKSMLKPKSDDKLIIFPFDTPSTCRHPYFEKFKVYPAKDLSRDWPINNLLPTVKDFVGPQTYLSLAKWSAAYRRSGNSLDKEGPFYLIIVSDMMEDMKGGCPLTNEMSALIGAHETLYLYNIIHFIPPDTKRKCLALLEAFLQSKRAC